LVAESVRDYGDRRPTDRPFFHPGAMDPLLSRAVANIAIDSPTPGQTVILDPMCGTGGILAEAGLVGAAVLGSDADHRMVRGTRRNLAEALSETQYAVVRADAGHLPVADDAIDTVVFDAPYGRQSKVTGIDGNSLISGALGEAKRVASRGVVVTDRPIHSLAQDAGWTVAGQIERPVHRSLTRYVHVLE
jgi:tRNA (guanine10-N2)-dimethyltransferase